MKQASGTRAVSTYAAVALLSFLSTAAVATPSAAAGSAATGGASWTVYHGNAEGNGVAASVSSVDLSSRAWTSPALDGQLYGEPLVSGGLVIVATENDTVYALSSATGAVQWSTHLGTPVPAGSLPCGNISPTLGITGTPVIDETRSEVFVVADELVNGNPAHKLVGLDIATGRPELNQGVDPAGSTHAALLQRTGLTLDAGRIVFGYGGNYGDCSPYHGWVVSVPEGGGTAAEFAVDGAPGESQGGVWMGGAAPVVDSGGNIWVTAGNGSVTSSDHPYDHSDSVLELSPSLTLLQYFAPSSWAADNAGDLDLSTAPALLADGQVVAAGKSRIVYLLSGSRLGGVGGQEAQIGSACGDDIDGGVAFVGTTVYLPCLSGPIAVTASSSSDRLRLLWSATAGGGPPVVAAGQVWTIGQDGVLYGLNPSTGAVQDRATIGVPANHFATASAGGGLLLAPATNRVVAFSAPTAGATGPSTTTAAPSTTTSGAPATTTSAPAAARNGTSPWGIAAAVVGALAVVGGVGWLFLRRRRTAGRSGRQ